MENQIDQNLNQELSIKKPGIIHYLFFAIALAVSGFFMVSVLADDFALSDYNVGPILISPLIAPTLFGLVLSLWFTYGNKVTCRVWKKLVLIIISWAAYYGAFSTFLSFYSINSGSDSKAYVLASLVGTLILSLGIHFLIKKLDKEKIPFLLVLGAIAGLVFNFFLSWDTDNIPGLSLPFIAWQLIMGFGFEFAVNGFFKKSSSPMQN